MFFGDGVIGMTEGLRTELEEVLVKYYRGELERGELPTVFKAIAMAGMGDFKLADEGGVPPVVNS